MRPPSYVWTSPARSLSIHLPLDLVQRLGLAAMEALKSVPRRGLEIGGVLLGRSEQRDGMQLIYLEGFLPVESEHRTGPSYVLSEADLERLDKAAKRSGAIGMYRTQTRSDALLLEQDDIDLFKRRFDGPNCIFLLIQPATHRAALFLSKDGALELAHELPFQAADLPRDEAKEPEAIAAATPAIPPPPEPSETRTARNVLAPFRRWLVPAAAGALGLAIGASTLLYRSPAPVEQPKSAPGRVGLNVERVGSGLRLQWDRDSAILRSASHASLYITDGDHQSKMDLGQRELTTGAVSYWPESQDVIFRLEISSAGGNTTDSIHFVAANPPPQSAPSQPAVVASNAAAGAKPAPYPAEEVRSKKPIPRAKVPRSEIARATEGTASREEVTDSRPSPFRASPEPSPAAAPAGETASTPAQTREPVMVATAPAVTAPPVRSVPRDDGVSVTAEPAKGSRLGRLVGKIPLVRRLRKEPQAFVPPKPLKEVKPSISSRERNALKGPVAVDVKVYVTEAGKVDFAELLSDGGSRKLAADAVYAARRWNFAPAQIGGEKAPGEVVLHFKFEP